MNKMLKPTITTLFVMIIVSGCYLPMSGTVIDAETKTPIEGAVVLVEWTKTKGIGFTYTESYKVGETLSDKEGKFKLPGCICIAVNEPDITIYKKGYIAWNNKYIFPYYKKRSKQAVEERLFMLERVRDNHSYVEHTSFIQQTINSTIGNKPLMEKAIRWEELNASSERDKR